MRLLCFQNSSALRKCGSIKAFYSILFCCILLFYPTMYFPLYYIHLILFSHSEHLPLRKVALFSLPHLCHRAKRSEQQQVGFKGATAKQEHIEPSQYQWISVLRWSSQMRSSRVERTALSQRLESTIVCSEMHGLPQSTTTPLLSQEFAGHNISPQHVDTLIPIL